MEFHAQAKWRFICEKPSFFIDPHFTGAPYFLTQWQQKKIHQENANVSINQGINSMILSECRRLFPN